MLDNPTGSSQEDLVERLRSARNSEPQSGPTDEEESQADTAEVLGEAETEEESDAVEEHEDAQEDAASFDEDYSESIDTIGYDYDDESDTYLFKSNGKKVRANADKLIERFSQAENYTKDKMSLAEDRKAHAEQLASDKASLDSERSKISGLVTQLEALVKLDESDDLTELEEYDPAEYIKQTRLKDSRKAALKSAQDQVEQAESSNYQDKVNRESQLLLKALPAWQDQEVMNKDVTTLNKYFASKGVTAQDIAGMVDHRIYVMALDAAKFQQMQAVNDRVKKQVKKAPKSVKSGLKRESKQTVETRSAKDKLKSSGHVNDAVAMLRAKRNKG